MYNNYRIRLNRENNTGDPIGLTCMITVENNDKFLKFLNEHENITFLTRELKEHFEINKRDNYKHKNISFEYTTDLNKKCDREVALCQLSDKAILLMKTVCKLYCKFRKQEM